MATLVIFERTSDLPSFLWSSLITFIAGLTMIVQGRPEDVHLRPRDMYLLTVTSWVVVGMFAALPFMFIQHMGLHRRVVREHVRASPPPAPPVLRRAGHACRRAS